MGDFGDFNKGKDYGDLDATKPKDEFVRSRKEFVLSVDPGVIVSREDLIEAGVPAFDIERREWAWPVVGSVGFPRQQLGVFIIRIDDAGKIQTSVE